MPQSKKIKFILFIIFTVFAIFNSAIANHPRAIPQRNLLNYLQFQQKIVGPYQIEIDLEKSNIEKDDLFKTGIIIDHYESQKKVKAYATLQDLQILKLLNISYHHLIPHHIFDEFDESLATSYSSYEDVTKKLFDLETKYPHLIKIESIGKTVQSRDIWVAKISQNPQIDLAKTEINLKSTMHGDEIVGQELLIKMIEYLLEEYSSNPRIRKIINESEIFIIPNINYDGTKMRRRGNAHNVDLNRDFPDGHTQDNINSTEGREIETQNIMNFTQARNFSLAMNFHGGAVVVNYPWDGYFENHPENDLLVDISIAYSRRNPPMYSSSYFKNGITNGYHWYPIYGGMQDWSYYYHDFPEFTVEVSQVKWPSFSSIEKYWNENKESLISFLENGHRGAKGIVRDKITQRPIQANYKIKNIDKNFKMNSPLGDFTKILLPGEYEFTFFAPDYENYTTTIKVDSNSYPENRIIEMQSK